MVVIYKTIHCEGLTVLACQKPFLTGIFVDFRTDVNFIIDIGRFIIGKSYSFIENERFIIEMRNREKYILKKPGVKSISGFYHQNVFFIINSIQGPFR
jgi:hypothetical protein